MEVETDSSVSVPVYIVGHKDDLVFFRFKPHQSDQYETGICKELFNDRKKSQKIKTKDYLSFGNDSSPCYTNMVVPLSGDEKYLAENGDSMFPKWQAKCIWHEVKSETKFENTETSRHLPNDISSHEIEVKQEIKTVKGTLDGDIALCQGSSNRMSNYKHNCGRK